VGTLRLVAFRGWPSEALEFYEGLTADNSKTYWLAHKDVYDDKVLAPMQALLAELEPKFGAGKIFRPYRDVRFSADKSPYKTHIGATLSSGGYIQLSANGLACGAGMWMMGPEQLDRYRKAVADDRTGAELGGIMAEVKAKGIAADGHDQLKTVPRGYPKDHPRADLLRNKGLITWKQWPVAAWLGTAGAKKRIVEFLDASRPLRDWLEANVGESTQPSR
jgi:uncharacterized protein (TIGR02453 family)